MQYTCQQCGNAFHSRKRGDRIVRFCSHSCYSVSKKGKEAWNKGKPAKWAIGNSFAKGHAPWNKGKKTWTKELNPRWKGGIYRTKNAYVFILSPSHPRANKRGYVGEHILVAESSLGRRLLKNEIVHHINEIKNDNRPENLLVFNNAAEHKRYHANQRNRLSNGQLI